MMDMLRVGDAPPGSTPFYKDADGRVGFDGQNKRVIDFGHAFDRERGYRPYFKFRDSHAANTWGASSLKDWADAMKPKNSEDRQLRQKCYDLAAQCTVMNRLWESRGRPAEGISMDPQGHA